MDSIGDDHCEPQPCRGDCLEHRDADVERTDVTFAERRTLYDEIDAVEPALLPGRLGDREMGDRRRIERSRVRPSLGHDSWMISTSSLIHSDERARSMKRRSSSSNA